jgi:hypothetical protein
MECQFCKKEGAREIDVGRGRSLKGHDPCFMDWAIKILDALDRKPVLQEKTPCEW